MIEKVKLNMNAKSYFKIEMPLTKLFFRITCERLPILLLARVSGLILMCPHGDQEE
ncbi:hypothetical protein NVIE_0925 [Nitrososphaera viennensis EN76]|uniref:Uncharacterized protein n=1 Tax=Nitrososphaera viennensis EN76 TaxID=926571 RepID=A0A060HNI5_9ARCH|nr:hypothetical protein NVIE_0925 [Nitrososphaera viennensis EN76]